MAAGEGFRRRLRERVNPEVDPNFDPGSVVPEQILPEPSNLEVARSIPPLVGTGLRQAVGGALEGLGDITDAPKMERFGEQVAEEAREDALLSDPSFKSFWQQAFQDAGVSIGTFAPLATAGAAGAIAGMGSITALQSYSDAKQAGLEPDDAAKFAAIDGIIEAGTEVVPAKILFAAGKPARQRLTQFLLAELPGEQVATIGQSLNAVFHGVDNDLTAGELIERMKSTAAATVVGGGVQSTAASAAHRFVSRETAGATAGATAGPPAEGFEPTGPAPDPAQLEQARAQIAKPGEVLEEELTSAVERRWDYRLTQELDSLHGIKAAEREMVGDVTETPNISSLHDIFRNLHGSRGIVESVVKEGTIGFQDNGDIVKTGEGLFDALEPAQGNLTDTLQYFVGKRAQDLNERGLESGFTDSQAQALVDLGNVTPGAKEAHERYKAFNLRMLDMLEQSGRIDAATKDRLKEAGENYVSFQRLQAAVDGKPYKAPRPLREFKGSNAKVIDTWEAITGNVAALTEMALQNNARSRFFDTVENSPTGAMFAIKKDAKSTPRTVSKEQVMARLKREGVRQDALDAVDNMSAEELTFFQTRPDVAPGNEVVWRDGKMEVWELNEEARALKRTFESLGPQETANWLKILGMPKRLLVRTVTSFPTFMVRNTIRDANQRWLLQSKDRIPMKGLISGFRDAFTQNEAYQDYIRNGGGFVSIRDQEQAVSRQELDRWYEQRGVPAKNVLRDPRQIWQFYQRVLASAELANRMAEFKAQRKGGASLQRATAAGRDISTDFAMRGASQHAKVISMLYPFLNARAQGLYRIGREASTRKTADRKERFMRLLYRGALGMAIPSAILYAMNHDDERYQALPEEVKDLNWVFFTPWDDKPYTIPKPFELGAVFATMPERITQAAIEQNGEFLPAFERMLVDTFSLHPVPQAGRPLADIAMNRSFGGVPIVPKRTEGLAPSEQAAPSTSETMRMLARTNAAQRFRIPGVMKEAGLKPAQMDALVEGYLGTLGTYLLAGSDALLTPGSKPDVRADQLPVLRAFFKQTPLTRTSFEQMVYDVGGEAVRLRDTINQMRRRGKDVSHLTDTPREQALFQMAPMAESFMDVLAQMNKELRRIRRDTTLDSTQKREQIDRLLEQKQQVSREAVRAGVNRKAISERVAELEAAIGRQ